MKLFVNVVQCEFDHQDAARRSVGSSYFLILIDIVGVPRFIYSVHPRCLQHSDDMSASND